MNLYVFDTDSLTLFQFQNQHILARMAMHTDDAFAISVITVEEQLSGWQQELSRARDDDRRAETYRRMALAVEGLSGWNVLPLTVAGLARVAGWRRQRLNVGSYDLKIGATAVEHEAIVVTRNLRDFQRLPNVRCEDWSIP